MAPHSAFQPPRSGLRGGAVSKLCFPCRGGRRVPALAEVVSSRGRINKVPGASPRLLSPFPVWLPHSSRRQWLPNSCARSSSGRPARARAPCARGSPRTLASSICPAATSCGRTSRPTRVRGGRGRAAVVNRSGIGLGWAEERPERGRGSSVPGALPPPACGRAGSYVPGRMQPVARGEGRGSLGGGWEVHEAPLSAGLLWGTAGNHPAEGARTWQLTAPSTPLALCPHGKASGQPRSPLLSPGLPRPSAAHLWESARVRAGEPVAPRSSEPRAVPAPPCRLGPPGRALVALKGLSVRGSLLR